MSSARSPRDATTTRSRGGTRAPGRARGLDVPPRRSRRSTPSSPARGPAPRGSSSSHSESESDESALRADAARAEDDCAARADARPSRRPPIARARGRVPPAQHPRRGDGETVVASRRGRGWWFRFVDGPLFFTHAGVLPRLGRMDDADARVDGAIDSETTANALAENASSTRVGAFAFWRRRSGGAPRETRGAFIVALRRVVRARHTRCRRFLCLRFTWRCGGVGAPRGVARRGRGDAARACRRGRWASWAARGCRGPRCARRAAGPLAAPAASRSRRPPEVRIPPARTAPARRSRGSRRAERGARRPVPARARFRRNPNPVNPAIPDAARASGRGPRRFHGALARPRPRPHPRPATRGPPRRRRAFPEPRDDDRSAGFETRTGFFRPLERRRGLSTRRSRLSFSAPRRPDLAPPLPFDLRTAHGGGA